MKLYNSVYISNTGSYYKTEGNMINLCFSLSPQSEGQISPSHPQKLFTLILGKLVEKKTLRQAR